MKPIFILCLLIVLGCCCQPILQQDKNAPILVKKILSVVKEHHLMPKDIDDTLSKELIDPDKLKFAANDQTLEKRWQKKVKYMIMEELCYFTT